MVGRFYDETVFDITVDNGRVKEHKGACFRSEPCNCKFKINIWQGCSVEKSPGILFCIDTEPDCYYTIELVGKSNYGSKAFVLVEDRGLDCGRRLVSREDGNIRVGLDILKCLTFKAISGKTRLGINFYNNLLESEIEICRFTVSKKKADCNCTCTGTAGVWIPYTVAVTNGGKVSSPNIDEGRYMVIGKTLFVRYDYSAGLDIGTTDIGMYLFSLPPGFTPKSNGNGTVLGVGHVNTDYKADVELFNNDLRLMLSDLATTFRTAWTDSSIPGVNFATLSLQVSFTAMIELA